MKIKTFSCPSYITLNKIKKHFLPFGRPNNPFVAVFRIPLYKKNIVIHTPLWQVM